MKKLCYLLLPMLLSSTCFADEYSEVVKTIGPWSIKSYKNAQLAQILGTKCAAIQYANGAQLIITANPDDPENKNTIKLLATFNDNFTDAIIYTNDGMDFNHHLNTFEPQRNASSDIFNISDFKNNPLFVTFSYETLTVGRYEFSLNDLASAADYVHQPQCIFANHDKIISKAQFDEIQLGASYSDVVKILGRDSDEGGVTYDADTNKKVSDVELWKKGFDGNLIVINFSNAKNKKVIKKYFTKVHPKP